MIINALVADLTRNKNNSLSVFSILCYFCRNKNIYSMKKKNPTSIYFFFVKKKLFLS